MFRVDASVEIGGGHARRCFVLAKALLRDGWSVRFATTPSTLDTVPSLRDSGIGMIPVADEPDVFSALRAANPHGCDLLVVDDYRLDESFEQSCRPWARRILVIDDLADRRHDCDVLLDQSPGRSTDDYLPLVSAGCRLLVGPEYALLDARFAEMRAKGAGGKRGQPRILVSFGATDPTGMSVLALAAIERAQLGVPVDVAIGSVSPHVGAARAAARRLTPPAHVHVGVEDMASLIAGAALAVGAGGVSALERCCLGLPSLLVVLAENQRANAVALSKAGAAIVVEEAALRDAGVIASVLGDLWNNPARLAAMGAAATQIVDGLGAMRVRGFCFPATAATQPN